MANRAALALAALAAAAHFALLMQYFEPAAAARDAQAYFGQARLLAHTGRLCMNAESPIQYVGYHWTQTGPNTYCGKYPPGLPVILAGARRVAGANAMLTVNPVLASASLALVFLICNAWSGAGWGFLAMLLLAANPLTNKHALYGDSHTASAFFLLLAIWLAVSWTRSRRLPLVFAAGLAAGFIPSIRYSEVLFLPALAAFVLLEGRTRGDAIRNVLAFAAGAAVPLAVLCLHNHAAYGAFWKTGYASEAGAFGWVYFRQAFVTWPQRMLAEGGAYAFALGAFGIAAACARRGAWKQGALLAALVIPSSLMYMSFHAAPFAPLRYLIPALPLFAIGAASFVKMLSGGRVAEGAVAAAVIASLNLYWGVPLSAQALGALRVRHRGLAMATAMLRAHAPEGSIVIADEIILQQLDSAGNWRLADEAVLLRRGRPQKAPAGVHESQQALTSRDRFLIQRYASPAPQQLLGVFEEDVRAWAHTRRVFWLTTRERMNAFTNGEPQNRGLAARRVLRIPPGPRRTPSPYPARMPEGAADPRFHLIRPGSELILYEWNL